MDIENLLQMNLGVFILSARDERNKLVGCAINSVSQVASEPLYIAFSCNNCGYTRDVIFKNKKCGISILPEDVDPQVIADFGFNCSKSFEKWKGKEYKVIDDLPFLKNCVASLSCKIIKEIEFENNTIFIAEVVSSEINKIAKKALTYKVYQDSVKKLLG